jgi:hypothetical protein
MAIANGQGTFQLSSEQTFDFGDIKQGDKVTHAFRFQNTGGDTLEIVDIKSSCGCTAVMASLKQIPPGQEGEIKTTFSSAGRRGNQIKHVNIETSDPKHPLIKLVLKGHVSVPFDISPPYLTFRSLRPGEIDSTSVSIVNKTQNKVIFNTPTTNIENFSLSLSKLNIDPGEKVKLVAIYTPPESIGNRLSGVVQIPVKEGEKKNINIRVYGFIKQ